MLRQKDSKISLLEYQLARVTHDLFQSRELSLRGKSIPKESYSCVSDIPKNLCGGAKGNNTNSANNICNDSYEFSGSSTSSYPVSSIFVAALYAHFLGWMHRTVTGASQ